MRVQARKDVAGHATGETAAVNRLISAGFESLAAGAPVSTAVGAALDKLVVDPKTRKAVEPHLSKLLSNAEGVMRGSKTAEAGLKALRDLAAKPEVRSRIGKELQGALGDSLGGQLGGHLGAVLAAFSKSGFAGAITSALAHAQPVMELIRPHGTAKVVDEVADKVAVVGLAKSVATSGKAVASGSSHERWVGLAQILANVVATVAPAWKETAFKGVDALKAKLARNDGYRAQSEAPASTEPPSAAQTVNPQASEAELFGGAVTPQPEAAPPQGAPPGQTVPAAASQPAPARPALTELSATQTLDLGPGADGAVKEIAKQVQATAEKAGAKISPQDAQRRASRLLVAAVQAVYLGREVDLRDPYAVKAITKFIDDADWLKSMTWSVSDRFAPAPVAAGATTVSPSDLVRWYAPLIRPPADSPTPMSSEEVVRFAIQELHLASAGAVPISLLNAYERQLVATIESYERGEPLVPSSGGGESFTPDLDVAGVAAGSSGDGMAGVARLQRMAEAAVADEAHGAGTTGGTGVRPEDAEQKLRLERLRRERHLADRANSGGGSEVSAERLIAETRLLEDQQKIRDTQLTLENLQREQRDRDRR